MILVRAFGALNRLISSDFCRIHCIPGIYFFAFDFLCSSFDVTLELQAPKQKIGEPLRFASKPDVFMRALEDRTDTGSKRREHQRQNV